MFFSYERFVDLIKETENIMVLYKYFQKQMKIPMDISDLLRWQWMQYISAFDKFIHDLVRIGMLEAFQGKRILTPKFKSFQMDYQTYQELKENELEADLIFEQKIIIKHGYLSFQDPEKIADALSFIWNEKDKWEKISKEMGLNKSDCIKYLKNIVIRRNQIVHEGDYTDRLSKRQDILEEDVIFVKEYILKLGKVIYDLVKNP